ncbi:MAG: hypothetical protein ACK42I_08525, partial [Thermomicrobium sp.]
PRPCHAGILPISFGAVHSSGWCDVPHGIAWNPSPRPGQESSQLTNRAGMTQANQNGVGDAHRLSTAMQLKEQAHEAEAARPFRTLGQKRAR